MTHPIRSSMHKGSIVGIALIVLAITVSDRLAKAQDVRVGFVNFAALLDNAPQSEAASQQIQQDFAKRDRDILAQQQELATREENLRRNAAIMSVEERTRQQGELRRLERELRRTQEEFREDLNLRRSEDLSALQKMMAEVIREMAREESYDLIITDGVIFAGENVDITDRILERLQARFEKPDS